MLKTVTSIPIGMGLIALYNKIPTKTGTTYGKIALKGVYTIDALGLIWVKNCLIDNILRK